MLYIAIILFILVTTGVAVLVFANISHDATFSLILGQVPLSTGLLLLLAFVLGALMFYFIAAALAMQDRQELKRLHARVAELEQASMRVPFGQLAHVPFGQPPPVSPVLPVYPTTPIVPMPGMTGPDISDMPTLH